MTLSVARVKSNVIFSQHTKGVLKFHKIRITKSKFIHIQIQVPHGKKLNSGKKFSGLQNGSIKGLQIEAGFSDYKLGLEWLEKEYL